MIRRATIRRVAPALLAICAAGATLSCSDDPMSPSARHAELERARSRWADAGISSYAMRQSLVCFCPPPRNWTVVVSAGVPQFIESIADSVGVSPSRHALESLALEFSLSVEEAFDLVERYLDTADRIDVTYDADRGFPTQISVDPDEQAADEEFDRTFSEIVDLGDRACTEIGCQDGFALVLVASAAPFRFAEGTYDVSFSQSPGAWQSCSFAISDDPADCSSGHCLVFAGCNATLLPTSPERVEIRFGAQEGALDVEVRRDGALVGSGTVDVVFQRLQPNGPLCPPVCYQARPELAVL